MLRRMLRLLAAYDFFREVRNQNENRKRESEDLSMVFYENTPRSDILREDHPYEVYNVVLHWHHDIFSAMNYFEDTIRKKEGEFPSAVGQANNGMELFEKINKPEYKNHSENFNKVLPTKTHLAHFFLISFFL